jgi:nitrate reductase NapE component
VYNRYRACRWGMCLQTHRRKSGVEPHHACCVRSANTPFTGRFAMTTKTTTLSIRISSEMRHELEALAEKNRLSLSDFVKRTLRENMTGRRFEQAQNDLTRLESSARDIDRQTAKLASAHRELLEKTQNRGKEMLEAIAAVQRQTGELSTAIDSIRKRERWERFTTLLICAMFLLIFGFVGTYAAYWLLIS